LFRFMLTRPWERELGLFADDDGGDDAGGGGGSTPKTIPYDRFQSVVTERNKLRDELAAAKKEAKESTEKAATADTLSARVRELETERKAERAEWDVERGLMEAGLVDQESRDLAMFYYNKLDPKTREPMPEWYKKQKEAPDKAPRGLQAILGEGKGSGGKADEAGKAEGGTGGKAEGGTGGKVDGGKAGGGLPKSGGKHTTTTTPGTSEPLSAEKLREIRENAMKTGDWTEWKRVRGHGDGGKAA
jgi:hypothetical protein